MKDKEFKDRLKLLQNKIRKKNLKVALIFHPLNIYYFTGLWFRGFLLVTEQEIALYVRRPYEQIKKVSKFPLYPLKSIKDLPCSLERFRGGRIALEYRGFNWVEGKSLEGLLVGFELTSLDELIWDFRMKKSPKEIGYLRRSGNLLKRALKKFLSQLKLSMSEILAASLLEYYLRKFGHPGFTRSANGFELGFGYLISGKEGLWATPYFTGEGGRGVKGFPGGASFKKLKKGEPILIDYSGFYKGYYVDQSRMVSFGKCKRGKPFFQCALKILETLEKLVKPGISCQEIYFTAERIVETYGFQEYFMRHGDRMNFIGHGVGLEIDEPPVIGPKNTQPLEEGMVIALEPKFHIPDLGVIGLEDTFLVTSQGLKRLTSFKRDWIYL